MLMHKYMRAKVNAQIKILNSSIARDEADGFIGRTVANRAVQRYLKWVLREVLKP